MLKIYFFFQWHIIIDYLISKYTPDINVNVNAICITMKEYPFWNDDKSNLENFIRQVLNNQTFTQSELDKILNSSYEYYDIFMMLIELGANINNPDCIIDILIVDNLHSDYEFNKLYMMGYINIVEKIHQRLECGDQNLKNFIKNYDFKNNVMNLLDISDRDYQHYVDKIFF